MGGELWGDRGRESAELVLLSGGREQDVVDGGLCSWVHAAATVRRPCRSGFGPVKTEVQMSLWGFHRPRA